MLKFDDILKQHLVVLGKTGAGKSSVLRVLVERLLDTQRPVCILDPKGDWHGLRAGANGTAFGYPVVIFGGEHADVPISSKAGNEVAELFATGNRSCIIDMRGWMVGERTRFFIDFAHTLFRTTRGTRHLVMDEVHNFAPQGKVLDPEAGKMLHWANRLASEGRGLGLTIASASQRPQKVHKDFLTCAETLIAMKVIHKLDRDAIKDWIDGCADITKGKQVLTELASLARGEAWVWSPEAGIGPMQYQFPKFKTYDSFSPSIVDDVTALPGWASVDLAAVSEKLAAVTAEHQANDPAVLKRRIAELERAQQTIESSPHKEELMHEFKRGREAGYMEASSSSYRTGWFACKRKIMDQLNGVVQDIDSMEPAAQADPMHEWREANRDDDRLPPGIIKNLIAPAFSRGKSNLVMESKLSPSARKIVDCIHRAYPVGLTFAAAARRAGISNKSSAYSKYCKEVFNCHEVDIGDGPGGRIRSHSEFAHEGAVTSQDGIETWVSKLPPSVGKMLRVIHANGPISKYHIASEAEVSPTSSGLGSGLRELIDLGLIVKEDDLYQVAEGL